jgi:hypothetical protein
MSKQNEKIECIIVENTICNNIIFEELEKKTVKELKNLCKERNIKGYSNKSKPVLIKYITNYKCDKPIQHLIYNNDKYTIELLQEQYNLHKSYVIGRMNSTIKIGVVVRLPSIPEDISENIVKFIIWNKIGDKTTTWDCKKGDLQSKKEGKQECKCFTSNGPISFTPTSEWDVIYFLDARQWLKNKFILYRSDLKRSSYEWSNIKVSNTQTFKAQCNQGRRPRITWNSLYPQINKQCEKIFEGSFDDIFTPLEIMK